MGLDNLRFMNLHYFYKLNVDVCLLLIKKTQKVTLMQYVSRDNSKIVTEIFFITFCAI